MSALLFDSVHSYSSKVYDEKSSTIKKYSSNNSQQAKKILVVEDDFSLREALDDTLSLANYLVVSAKHAEQAMEILSKEKDILMVVSDINMGVLSGHDLLQYITEQYAHIPVLLMTAYGSVRDSVDAIRNGAVDYLVKPFEPKELVDIVHRQLGCAVVNQDDEPIAEDPHSQQLLTLSARVAQSNSTALILGESGTGKEVLARFIHQHSTRADKPFVAINCAAIPENMLESMLFGYEKGAYTGALVSTPGKFEQANGGTLLLDEISEMDVGLQAKLLRVLQEQEVERLGGKKLIQLDVRVIATSNRNMAEHVAQGKFREDLYYRLSVLPLVWKPLRERPKDILPLAQQLLTKHSNKQKRTGLILTHTAQQALLTYPWPGNVRELDNVIQRALILQLGSLINAEDLGLDIMSIPNLASVNAPTEGSHLRAPTLPKESSESNFMGGMTPEKSVDCGVFSSNERDDLSIEDEFGISQVEASAQCLGDNLQQKEFEIIANTLKEEGGSRKNTAERLGISPRTLRYKLAKMREVGMEGS
ncbi:MAG: two-component system response regulator FlrC [Candidatus Endobugula sp.]|jgi:two-component system response regulator FlrC